MTAHRRSIARDAVTRAERLRLSVTDAPWPLAVDNAAAIARHFTRRQDANPSFYDGQVFVLREVWQDGATVGGDLSLERFSSFLYWRDGLGHDAAMLDGFGAALVRSAEGHVLAIVAAADTLNAGRVYLPGGFIDARDARADGTIDIDASIARELAEETGLDGHMLHRVPGYLIARHGRHCCFCVEFRSSLSAGDLRSEMLAGAACDAAREVADVVVVRDIDDLARHAVLEHARLVIGSVLTEQRL